MKDKELKIHKMQLDNTYIIEPVKENIVLMTKSAYMSLLKRIKKETRRELIKKIKGLAINKDTDSKYIISFESIQELEREMNHCIVRKKKVKK